MNSRHSPRWRLLTIVAQDPSVKDGKSILKAKVPVVFEEMGIGPVGYRVQVVDYDASTDSLMKPWEPMPDGTDPYVEATDAVVLEDPKFHQQNVYTIVMRTLGRFEQALGRRVSWSFGGHQLKVIPHAFADANAFYAKEDEALYFGYFKAPAQNGRSRTVFSCLSHDVIAHETTHALLDGLRGRYTDPSSPDQAAFHEGFSDIVALLSIFSLREVVAALVCRGKNAQRKRIPASWLTPENLRVHSLFSLAEEMGEEMSMVRGSALRRSAELKPRPGILNEDEFMEEHRRGEVLVAAVLGAMIEVWSGRVKGLAKAADGSLDVARVVEEGRLIADRLLTMCIRAIDYCPPVHMTFGDYLSSLVTADREINPDDTRYEFRKRLIESFASYGIAPASPFGDSEKGVWGDPEIMENKGTLVYDRTHFEPMQRDPDEVFRFIWENRKALELREGAYTRVQSVRPCVRVGDDGFTLRETVAEYIQILRLKPDELTDAGFTDPGPQHLPRDREVFLYGGGVLIFDEYGQVKFHVHNRLENFKRQSERLDYLAKTGYYERQRPLRKPAAKMSSFGMLHMARSLGGTKWTGKSCGCGPGAHHDLDHSLNLEDDEAI